jgi:hypothetical protein
MRNKILILPLLIIALTVVSCGSGEKKTEENAGTEVQGKVPKEINLRMQGCARCAGWTSC